MPESQNVKIAYRSKAMFERVRAAIVARIERDGDDSHLYSGRVTNSEVMHEVLELAETVLSNTAGQDYFPLPLHGPVSEVGGRKGGRELQPIPPATQGLITAHHSAVELTAHLSRLIGRTFPDPNEGGK